VGPQIVGHGNEIAVDWGVILGLQKINGVTESGKRFPFHEANAIVLGNIILATVFGDADRGIWATDMAGQGEARVGINWQPGVYNFEDAEEHERIADADQFAGTFTKNNCVGGKIIENKFKKFKKIRQTIPGRGVKRYPLMILQNTHLESIAGRIDQ
jgi:hypothetical protein